MWWRADCRSGGQRRRITPAVPVGVKTKIRLPCEALAATTEALMALIGVVALLAPRLVVTVTARAHPRATSLRAAPAGGPRGGGSGLGLAVGVLAGPAWPLDHNRLEPLSAAIRDIAWKAQNPALREVSTPSRRRQAKGRGHDRHSPRNGRFHLGDRADCAAAAPGLIKPSADKGERRPTPANPMARAAGDRVAVGNPRDLL